MRQVIGLLIVIFTILLVYNFAFYTPLNTDYNKLFPKTVSTNQRTDQTPFDECVLNIRDPWEGNMSKFVDLKYETKRKCNTDFKAITYLSEGRLFVHKQFRKTHECAGRCVNRKTDKSNIYGAWKIVDKEKGSEPFLCDIVEALCLKKQKEVYGKIHSQIVPRPKKYRNKFLYGQQYNVHVLLLDSTASTQAYRNLPNTMNFLEQSMGSITFPFVNKIGLNSKPSGVAMWFGKLLRNVDKIMFGTNSIEPDVDERKLCWNYFDDNMTTIMREFTDRGYMSLMAEDDIQGTVNYPSCNGLKTPPTDHYMRPYQIANGKSGAVKNTNKLNNCFLPHQAVFEYFRNFLTEYKDRLTFSWLWMVDLGHDRESRSRIGDTDILQLLLDHRNTFDNSFFILMGDHGLRFGSVTKTPLGSLEVNNPMFTISLPKELRTNKALVDKLRYNSRFLQTPFDIRATLLDILKYQPQSNYTSHGPLKMDGERGESLMRAQLTPRNCKDLPIPTTFCICQIEKKPLNTSDPLAGAISRQIIEEINKQLRTNKVFNQCERIHYNRTTKLERFSKNEGVYYISFETEKPAYAHFWTIVQMAANDSKANIGDIDRLDRYGYKGNCVHQKLRHLCICKKR